jgi:hypothetical protein
MFGVAVILLAGFGFVFKLVEFAITLTRGDIINFAVVPVTVYLTVAGGFFLLFLWAAARGHLRDVEAPKHRILEMEAEYRRRGL